jgi:hypothetical protein
MEQGVIDYLNRDRHGQYRHAGGALRTRRGCLRADGDGVLLRHDELYWLAAEPVGRRLFCRC